MRFLNSTNSTNTTIETSNLITFFFIPDYTAQIDTTKAKLTKSFYLDTMTRELYPVMDEFGFSLPNLLSTELTFWNLSAMTNLITPSIAGKFDINL